MPHRVHSASANAALIPSETLPGTTVLIDTVTQMLNSQQIHYHLADRIAKSVAVTLPAQSSIDAQNAIGAYQSALEKLKGSVKAAKAGNMVNALVKLRETDTQQA